MTVDQHHVGELKRFDDERATYDASLRRGSDRLRDVCAFWTDDRGRAFAVRFIEPIQAEAAAVAAAVAAQAQELLRTATFVNEVTAAARAHEELLITADGALDRVEPALQNAHLHTDSALNAASSAQALARSAERILGTL